MTIEVKVNCDGLGCFRPFEDNSDPECIESMVEDAGWMLEDENHYCPTCTKEIKRERKLEDGCE